MRINPIQFEIESIFLKNKYNYKTYILDILNFDWINGSTSLFEIGVYQGEFAFEILFHRFIINKIKEWLNI